MPSPRDTIKGGGNFFGAASTTNMTASPDKTTKEKLSRTANDMSTTMKDKKRSTSQVSAMKGTPVRPKSTTNKRATAGASSRNMNTLAKLMVT